MKSTPSLSIKKTILASCIAIAGFATSVHATSQPEPVSAQSILASITMTVYGNENYQVNENSKMFPAPAQGMTQHIITLPSLADEQHYKMEIDIGRTALIDCNKHGLTGELQQLTLKGWGYDYYQVDTITDGPSTMMACFDKAKTASFLTIPGPLMLNYDSRLPKVFYLPQGAQLRYRIWSTHGEYQYSPEQ